MDQFLPAIPLKDARVVVLGAGEPALNKLRLFRTAPCELVWCTLGVLSDPAVGSQPEHPDRHPRPPP